MKCSRAWAVWPCAVLATVILAASVTPARAHETALRVVAAAATKADARCGTQPTPDMSCCGASSCPYTGGVCCQGGSQCCPQGSSCSAQGCVVGAPPAPQPAPQPAVAQGCPCTPPTCQAAPCPCPCQLPNAAPLSPAAKLNQDFEKTALKSLQQSGDSSRVSIDLRPSDQQTWTTQTKKTKKTKQSGKPSKPSAPPGKVKVRGDCSVWGEPHINTFDSRRYQWQAPGEWVLLQDKRDNELVHSYLQRQSSNAAAVFQTAFAFKSGRHVLTVELTEPEKSNNFVVTLDRKKLDLSGSSIQQTFGGFRLSGCLPSIAPSATKNGSKSLLEEADVLSLDHKRSGSRSKSKAAARKDACLLTVTSKTTNTAVRVEWSRNHNMRHLSLVLYVDHSLKHNRKTDGLCGSFDGMATNDLRTKDGRIVTDPVDSAPTWQVKAEDSLMSSPPSDTPQTKPQDAVGTPNLLKLAKGDQTKVNQAEEKCSFLRGPLKADCVVDFLKGMGNDAPNEATVEQRVEDEKPKVVILRPCGQGKVVKGSWLDWSTCQLPLSVSSVNTNCGKGRQYRQRDLRGADGTLCGVEKQKRGCSIPCPSKTTPQKPLAEANGPYLGWAGEPLQLLSVGSRDVDGHPLKEFNWDFKDGSKGSKVPYPRHNFTKEGNYTVILTVTSQAGLKDSDQARVVIKKKDADKNLKEELLGGPYYTGSGGSITIVPRPPMKGDAHFDEMQIKKREDDMHRQRLNTKQKGILEASAKARAQTAEKTAKGNSREKHLKKLTVDLKKNHTESGVKYQQSKKEIKAKQAQLAERKAKHKQKEEQQGKQDKNEQGNKKQQNSELKKKRADLDERKKKLEASTKEAAGKEKAAKAEAKAKRTALEKAQKAFEKDSKEKRVKAEKASKEVLAKAKAQKDEAAAKKKEAAGKAERKKKADEKVLKARAERAAKSKVEAGQKAAAEKAQKKVAEGQAKKIAELSAKRQTERNQKAAVERAAKERTGKERAGKERVSKERSAKERAGKERSGKARERSGKERGAKARERTAKWHAERANKARARERVIKFWRRRRRGRGDPHLETFDGRRFSFQTPGRFILYQDKHNREKLISLQHRIPDLKKKGSAKRHSRRSRRKQRSRKAGKRSRKRGKRGRKGGKKARRGGKKARRGGKKARKGGKNRRSKSLLEEFESTESVVWRPRFSRRRHWSSDRVRKYKNHMVKLKKKRERAIANPDEGTWFRDFEFHTRDGVFKLSFRGSEDAVALSWKGRTVPYPSGNANWGMKKGENMAVYGDLRVKRTLGSGNRKLLEIRSVRSLTAVTVRVGRVRGRGAISLSVHVEGYIMRLENNGGLLGVPDGDENNDFTSRTGEISDDFMVTAPTWRVGWKESEGTITTKTKLRINLLKVAGGNAKKLERARKECSVPVPAGGVMQDDCVLDYLESGGSKDTLKTYERLFKSQDIQRETRLKKECQPRRAQKENKNPMVVATEATWSQWGVCKGSCGQGWRKRWRRTVGVVNGNKIDCGYVLEKKRCRLRRCEAMKLFK